MDFNEFMEHHGWIILLIGIVIVIIAFYSSEIEGVEFKCSAKWPFYCENFYSTRNSVVIGIQNIGEEDYIIKGVVVSKCGTNTNLDPFLINESKTILVECDAPLEGLVLNTSFVISYVSGGEVLISPGHLTSNITPAR